jgi:enoyl-CoA hydratase/carnithine racemase
MADAIYQHPYPTIAMLNGAAIGAGFLIATACDLRVAVAGASIGVPSAKLGVIYTSRGIELAREVAGTAATKELLFVGETVTAERARDMGLVNHVVDRDELEDHTYDIATRIAANAPLSLTGTKEIIHALTDSATFDETDEEWIADLRQRAFDSRDHEEGKRAFAENRDPEFEGR